MWEMQETSLDIQGIRIPEPACWDTGLARKSI